MAESEILTAFRSGDFKRAHRLCAETPSSESVQVLTAEILTAIGRHKDAVAIVRRLKRIARLSKQLESRCDSLLGDFHWYEGRLSSGLESYQRASTLARESGDESLRCRAAIQLLERVCDSSGFNSSLPLAGEVRRCVARCPDHQLHAQAHLTFGRLEAKAGRFAVAQKHFGLVRHLLQFDPNKHIFASVDLDESVVLWMAGDIAAATELAERGCTVAAAIGWSRGCVAGYSNLACLYVCSGQIEKAHDQIRLALAEDFDGPSYRMALTDTAARAFMVQGDYDRARGVLDEQNTEESVQPWYKLTTEQTRVRLLLKERKCADILARIDHSIAEAKDAQLAPLEIFFRLAKLEAQLESGSSTTFDDLPLASFDEWPLGLVGSYHSVLGRALCSLKRTTRGRAHQDKAQRLWAAAGDVAAMGTDSGFEEKQSISRDSADSGTHLDSAVALLELSGHPHIMAREAFAMVQDAGCAEAVALGARGPLGTRLIAAAGWSEAAARAALQTARDDELMPVGPHRDETWVLLARPRAELDHRCTLAAIRKLVGTARTLDQYRRDEKQRAALWPAEALEGDAESLWISEQSAELLSIARRIATSTLPVLLTGETGTGKEMLARVIHRASDRAAQPLHPFNCTAVPGDMLDSQLFGYRRGAFTGAEVSFPGVLRAAAGGTLFLDEIGEIGLDAQPKLLRFLEHSEIHPLGEPHPMTVDVRIIAATNANLEALVAQRQFREDLLYRLNVLKLHLPPLRERREEIPPLVQHYIRKYGDEQRKGRPTLSDETLEYLLLYSWPGNLRQLANEVRRMIALAEPDATLTPAFLSKEILNSRRTVPAADAVDDDEVLRLRLDQPLPAAVELVEQTLVRRALERSNGRVEDAARLLGISRKGLFLKRRRWGLRIGA